MLGWKFGWTPALVACLWMLMVSGCTPKTGIPRLDAGAAPGPDPGLIVPGPVEPDSRLVIGLTEIVDPDRAPVAGNDAEALVFGQLYEPLVDIDAATGDAIPGLATAWSTGDDGRTWRFVIDRSRQFHDGRSLSAVDVIASWRRTAALPRPEPWNGPWAWIDPDSLFAPDASELRVVLRRPAPASLFAHSHLAVMGGRPPGTSWRLGTGPWRLAVAGSQQLVCVSVRTTGRTRRQERELVFRLAPGADPRDLLDRGVDLLVTRSDQVRAYAETLDEYRIFPMPPNREYVLASPVPIPDPMREDEAETGLRTELAALIGGEIIHEVGFDPAVCTDRFPPSVNPVTITPGSPRNNRVIRFSSRDLDAGRLAGRLVAVASEREGIFGMSGNYASEATGSEGLIDAGPAGAAERFLIPVRRVFPDPCLQREALFDAIGMPVLGGDVDAFGHRNTLERRVLPLLRTAPVLIYRASVGGLYRGWNGDLRLGVSGRLKGASP